MSAQVYTMAEVMPEQKDVEKIVTAKLSYDKAKSEKSAADFDAWINDRAVFFKVAPRGLAYTVSQKSYSTYAAKCRQNRWKTPKPYAPQALRYFVIAVTIGWTELVDELKKILKYWDFTSADLQQYAKDVWQVPANIDTIAQMIDQVQQSNKITLVEAVEKHAKLNSKLFTKDEVLKETVRKKMLEIVDEFLDNLKEQNIEIKVKDVLLVGSNANYNYTKDSDIDLHIIADTKNMKYEMEIANALYSAYRTLFNKNLDINIYDIPLELYVEVENTPRNSNGVYSIKKDKWEKKPVQEDIPEYDTEALGKLVDKWENKCKDLLDKIAADKLDDEKQVVKLIEDIYEKLRKTGVAKSEYAIENLAFKELRNKGYLDKLKAAKHELISKRLSLEETLTRQARDEAYRQLTHAAGTQPIIQSNGLFFVYNLKASEISQRLRAIRQLPFVVSADSHESGKYDFSNVLELAMNKMPSKYYNIRGQIDETLI